jgi:ABC-type glycerol-3-phosphate transport system substrate-binding protein
MMIRKLHRETNALADAFAAGKLSRRSFVNGLLGLGLSAPAISALVAEIDPAAAAAMGLKGNVRFLVGPWSPNEVDNQKKIGEGFSALNPDVTFEFKVYDWETSGQEINTSVASGAHDVYMTTESSYPDYEAGTGFVDLASRINDPSFADERAKYLYMDRTLGYGPKIMGLPISFHVESALFVNMDMVKAAGFDETFADSWGTFRDCLAKMNKPGEVYGIALGVQPYGEWYQVLRAAGGSFLTPDLSAPNVNKPEVIDATERMASLFKDGIAAPLGTYNYDDAPGAFAAGKLAILSIDLAATTVVELPLSFEWKLIPNPPQAAGRMNFNDITYYMINSQSDNQDLMWEVVKWWTDGKNDAFWADNSGTYPARTDAPENGYGTNATPQLEEALPAYKKYAVGLENFTGWADVEGLAGAEVQKCFSGDETAEAAIANVEKIVKQETGL